jgi:glycosyltransferase involved in cell wall biosynthesis
MTSAPWPPSRLIDSRVTTSSALRVARAPRPAGVEDEPTGAPPLPEVPQATGAAIGRLALVTDAWHPQTNGVVNTLSRLLSHLESVGTEVRVIAPDGHRTVPLPSYPEIRVTCDPWRAVRSLRRFGPEAIHVATEGPLGLWIRGWLGRRGLRFTTSYHTRFPEYLSARLPVPLRWGYRLERWFHGGAERTLVGTMSLIRVLRAAGVGRRLVHWPRGVDTDLFHPDRRRRGFYPLPRPIWLYVGRVAVEKSLEDFLGLALPGTKVVVGDGPARGDLQRRFPTAIWRGWRFGHELAEHFASADCFVFPSRTDTFGNVILEAMASGLPVASVPAPGPLDLIEDGVNGALGEDLHQSCVRALRCSGEGPRATALRHGWSRSLELFRAQLVSLWPEVAGRRDVATA